MQSGMDQWNGSGPPGQGSGHMQSGNMGNNHANPMGGTPGNHAAPMGGSQGHPMPSPLDDFFNPTSEFFFASGSSRKKPPEPPNLPMASPLISSDVMNPVQGDGRNDGADYPVLRTPAISAHQSLRYPGGGGSIDFAALGGSSQYGGGLEGD